MNLELKWKFSNMPQLDIASCVTAEVGKLARQYMPDLADMFPFQSSPEMKYYFDENWMIFRIKDRYAISTPPCVGIFSDEEVKKVKEKIFPFTARKYSELYNILGEEWFSFGSFTYVGPFSKTAACWSDIEEHIRQWLNHLVIPEILNRNQIRVLRAIPNPPEFNLNSIIKSLWILECDETCKQGTAFQLSGVGVITCDHVLGKATKAFRADNPSKKYEVEIIKRNNTIDLAILRIKEIEDDRLEFGSADNLKQMDHVAISGFPNYRLGDSGVIIPGLVIGYRMVSGIRRILTNAPIVAGNSGGPVLDSKNNVIGVAVTGSDRMEEAQKTENHGIIPIDAIKFLV